MQLQWLRLIELSLVEWRRELVYWAAGGGGRGGQGGEGGGEIKQKKKGSKSPSICFKTVIVIAEMAVDH